MFKFCMSALSLISFVGCEENMKLARSNGKTKKQFAETMANM